MPLIENNELFPLVSIIIPVYNTERYIKYAIDSARNQSYRNIEIIVVDDGSTDKTAEIVQREAGSDPRIEIISLEKNQGVSHARNVGMQHAKGKWVVFLDDDDTLGNDYVHDYMSVICDTSLPYKPDIIIGINNTEGNAVLQQYINSISTDSKLAYKGCWIDENQKKYLLTNLINPYTNRPDHIALCNELNGMIAKYNGYIWSKMFNREFLLDNQIFFNQYLSMREDAAFMLEAYDKAQHIMLMPTLNYTHTTNGSGSTSFHPIVRDEMAIILAQARNIWTKYELDAQDYQYGVLIAYMLWLKLYAMHPDNLPYGIKKQNGKDESKQHYQSDCIKKSYDDSLWNDAFKNIDASKLSSKYKMLHYAFNHKNTMMIKLLKDCNDLKKGIINSL